MIPDTVFLYPPKNITHCFLSNNIKSGKLITCWILFVLPSRGSWRYPLLRAHTSLWLATSTRLTQKLEHKNCSSTVLRSMLRYFQISRFKKQGSHDNNKQQIWNISLTRCERCDNTGWILRIGTGWWCSREMVSSSSGVLRQRFLTFFFSDRCRFGNTHRMHEKTENDRKECSISIYFKQIHRIWVFLHIFFSSFNLRKQYFLWLDLLTNQAKLWEPLCYGVIEAWAYSWI